MALHLGNEVVAVKTPTVILNKPVLYVSQQHNIHFIYTGIYVRATCFDLVGHPQALQEQRYKSC